MGNDSRLESMLAAQAAHQQIDSTLLDEVIVLNDASYSEEKKKDILQRALNMAASNGDPDKVERLLSGDARKYIDVNLPDEDGTSPLIYASCFVRLHLPKNFTSLGYFLVIASLFGIIKLIGTS